MPSLGADMESGTLVEWLKQPGDKVRRGDIVAVVETQKGAIEIEIFQDGVIGKLLVQPGTQVPVGAPLAELQGGATESPPSPPVAPPPIAPPPETPTIIPPPPPMPTPPRLAGTSAVPAASPAARKLAAEHGLDLTAITGSGPGGAIVYVDVEQVLKTQGAAAAPKPKAAGGLNLGEMRKAIAAAMSRAKREIPHYYLAHTIDVSPAVKWLEGINADRAPAQRLLLGALLAKATANALLRMPDFNGVYVNDAFHASKAIHVGMAIAIRGGGLIAPAIHDANLLSLDDIMAKLRDLVARVRSGRLRGSEIADPTITVSSLGDRGVDTLYGVIHPPQVAIVGFGTPQIRPWVIDGAVVPASLLTMTLAADHRVTDGHRGALFLAAIAEALRSPEAL